MIEFLSMFLELFLRLALPTTLKRFALFGRSLRSLPTQSKLAYASRGFRLASCEISGNTSKNLKRLAEVVLPMKHHLSLDHDTRLLYSKMMQIFSF